MADQTGQQFGNYQLIRLLGQGGFADVYLGKHVHLNMHAAIKILRSRLISSTLEDFRTEAQTIARLIHPNIVRVLEFGVENSVAFLVMDYAPNGSLLQRHARGTLLPPVAIVPYVKQIAAALQYAHDSGLIHRDVKPENMLVGYNNDILLSDFGLVLPAQSSGSLTTKEMAGTVPYMAPEQIKGKPRPASDQYALGVVIYEWLSGDRPFQGSAFEIYGQHLHTPPPSLREKLPTLSPMIEQVVFTALAKEPHQRFPSIELFADAFERACQQTQQPSGAFPSRWLPPDQSTTSTLIRTPSVQPPPVSPASCASDRPTDPITASSQTQQPFASPSPLQSSLPGKALTPRIQPALPTNAVPSPRSSLSRRSVSRRSVLVGLTGLVALGLVGSGTALIVHSSVSPTPTPARSTPIAKRSVIAHSPTTTATQHPTASTTPAQTPDPTASTTSDPTPGPTTDPTVPPPPPSPIFIHNATSSNTSGYVTEIDHALTNKTPDAILNVTQNWNPGGNGGIYNNHSIGVFFNSSSGRWAVFNQDTAPMPLGAAFNIEVLSASDSVFIHQATSSNIGGHATAIDPVLHPLTSNNPNAILMVTQNWNPPGSSGVYNNHSFGVFYHPTGHWDIFNEDDPTMPLGAAFNVEVLSSGATVFIHQATTSNIGGHATAIDHPLTNNNPNAILMVTQNWNPPSSSGVYNNHFFGVFYHPTGHWDIFNEDDPTMPVGASFNVKVLQS